LEILVKGDDVNKAIKIFKRKLQREGLFRELKNRRHYEKPSVRRRRKQKEAERRLRKKLRRQARA